MTLMTHTAFVQKILLQLYLCTSHVPQSNAICNAPPISDSERMLHKRPLSCVKAEYEMRKIEIPLIHLPWPPHPQEPQPPPHTHIHTHSAYTPTANNPYIHMHHSDNFNLKRSEIRWRVCAMIRGR